MKKGIIVVSVIALVLLFSIGYLVKTDFFFKRKLNIEGEKCGYGNVKPLDCFKITSIKVWVDEKGITERIMKNYDGWEIMKLDWSGLIIVKEDEYSNYMDEYMEGLKTTAKSS